MVQTTAARPPPRLPDHQCLHNVSAARRAAYFDPGGPPYFVRESLANKDALYRKFHAALRPGGVLFAGGTEFISNWQGIGFNSYGTGFYQQS